MNDKKSKLSLNDLERHLWEAAHIITGPIDASDYKTYIFPILFFKRVCDVYDEEFEEAMEFYGDEEMAKAPEQHRIEVPEGCHWNDVIAATKDVGKALKAAFLGIEKTNDRLYGIFGDAPWTNKERLPDHLLLQLLNHFNKIRLGVGHVRDDDMGRAYDSEQDIRKKVIEADMIEAVIGLGPNLFYNSPMESCVVILRMNKPRERKNKVLFINGVKEVTRERAFSFLSDKNLERLVAAYFEPEKHEEIARLADIEEIRENMHNLSIPLYVHNGTNGDGQSLESTIEAWQVGRVELKKQSNKLFAALADIGISCDNGGNS